MFICNYRLICSFSNYERHTVCNVILWKQSYKTESQHIINFMLNIIYAFVRHKLSTSVQVLHLIFYKCSFTCLLKKNLHISVPMQLKLFVFKVSCILRFLWIACDKISTQSPPPWHVVEKLVSLNYMERWGLFL